jgi:hypothetical protein
VKGEAVGGRKEWQREYVAQVGAADVMRVEFDLDRGQVTDFLVQYEALVDGRWEPIVRYDAAHGQPHRDVLMRGEPSEKSWLHGLSYAEAMEQAIHDIRTNWATYRAAYLKENANP